MTSCFRCLILDITLTSAFAYPTNLVEEKPDSFNADLVECFDGMDNIFWDRFYSPLSKKLKDLVSSWLGLFKEEADEKFLQIERVSRGLDLTISALRLNPLFQGMIAVNLARGITDCPGLS